MEGTDVKASLEIETDRLRQLLDYDPVSGEFRRKVGNWAGKKAGCIDPSKRGYIRINLDGMQLYAHRLAWQHHYGDLPIDMQIDHINGDRSDNRIENLRLATPRENQRNYSLPRTNTSGYKGVSYHKKARKWKAQIRLAGTRPFKYFDTAEEASAWYESMAAKHFGEFAKPANDNHPQSHSPATLRAAARCLSR